MYPTINAPKKIHTQNMYGHPEWPKFSRLMRESGVGPLKINQAWGLLMTGLATQENLNAQGRKRDTNPHYEQLASLLEPELAIKPGTSLALWAGGFGVSIYAQQKERSYARGKRHTTLESTTFGKVLNALELHVDWGLQGPLWNAISRAFVKNPSCDVHIYLRTYDPNSVLIREEVPGLRRLEAMMKGKLRMHWHALYTDEKDRTWEITRDLQLVPEADFPNRDLCAAALVKFLIYRNENPSNFSAKWTTENILKPNRTA
jgi:hypothetical protein